MTWENTAADLNPVTALSGRVASCFYRILPAHHITTNWPLFVFPPKNGSKKGAKKGATPMLKGPDHPIQILGKPHNNVAIGIVGMPNIGKSSLFNVMTKMSVPAQNFPFCTIKPTDAKVPVPDARFDHLVKHFKPKSVVPAVLTVTDIAGLVRGAHEGKGLGNEFLSNIQQVDAIYHVCRAFKDKEIEHVEGEVDPCRDLDIISNELVQKDLRELEKKTEVLQKDWDRGLTKTKAHELNLEIHKKAVAILKEGKDIREHLWKEQEREIIDGMYLLTAKPIVYLVNVASKDFAKGANKWFMAIKEWCIKRSPGAPCIPFSAKFEEEFNELAEDKQKELNATKGSGSSIPKIIVEGYHALDMIHYFTVGEDEVRAWTIRKGTDAPKAAGVIHSDLETGFINCDQYTYQDFVENDNSVQAVAKAGKVRQQGKKYIVQDGDILFFRSTKATGAKSK
eukprot:g40330.t1